MPSALDDIPPLRHRFLGEIVAAPELERFLAPPDLDLAVTDQLQAVSVRVRAGVELLDRRILAAYVVAVRRQGWLALAYGTCFGAAIGAWLALDDDRVLVGAIVSVLCGIVGVALVLRHVSIRRDMATLRALRAVRRLPFEEASVDGAASHGSEAMALLSSARRLHETVQRVVSPPARRGAEDDASSAAAEGPSGP